MPIQLDTSIAYGQPRQSSSTSPFEMIDGLMNLKRNQQQIQAADMLMRERQDKFDDDEMIDQVLQHHATTSGADPDVDKVIYELQGMGRGRAALGLQNRVFEWRKQQADTMKTELDNKKSRFELASRMAQGISDPVSFKRILPQIEKTVGKELASQLGTEYNPGVIEQVIAQGHSATDNMTAQSNQFERAIKVMTWTQNQLKEERGWEEKQPMIAQKWTEIASGQLSLPGTKTQEDWDMGLKMIEAGMSGLPTKTREQVLNQFDKTFSNKAKEDARLLGMAQNERSVEARAKETHALEVQKAADLKAADVPLTPKAIDMLALSFAKGAPMPAFGMGQHAANDRKLVFDRAADMFENLPLAEMQAAYGAHRASLVTQQRLANQLSSYENTALANLKIMKEQAKKILDTGSPLLNKPLRTFDEKVLGSPEMAAFQTARRVVIPEFTRLLTAGPQMGGVLSDSARAEVEDIMKGDATLGQMLRSADILVQDAANRKKSVTEEITAIKALIAKPPELIPAKPPTTVPGGGPGLNPGMPQPPDAPAPSGLKPNLKDEVVVQNGIKYRISTDARGNLIGTPVVVR